MRMKMLLAAGMIFSGCNFLYAQEPGLEGIVVEKYYVTTAADTVGGDSTGHIPVGAVTYRVYADLKPVYRLQAVFGVPEHELRIATTTRFYNSAIGDGRSANDIHPSYFKYGTVMLDSWVSVGAAALDYQALLKTEDDTAASTVFQHSRGLLRNQKGFEIPLTEKDGIRFLRYQPATQYYNLDNDLRIFEYQSRDSVEGIFSTRNGAWASYGGSVGPQPDNRVLIAQLTTDGVLTLELNIQVAVPDGGSQRFVARNPVGDEILLPSLLYKSADKNEAPVIEVSMPKRFVKGEKTQVKAKVSDADGQVTRVDFYENGRWLYADTAAPFEMEYVGSGSSVNITAVATDNAGARSTSANNRME